MNEDEVETVSDTENFEFKDKKIDEAGVAGSEDQRDKFEVVPVEQNANRVPGVDEINDFQITMPTETLNHEISLTEKTKLAALVDNAVKSMC